MGIDFWGRNNPVEKAMERGQRAARLRGMSGSTAGICIPVCKFRPPGMNNQIESLVEGESLSSRPFARHVRLNGRDMHPRLQVSPSRDEQPDRKFSGGRESLEPPVCAACPAQRQGYASPFASFALQG